MVDFKPYFEKYEQLIETVNAVFDRVTKEYPECVKCGVGCDDCCYALFDLTLIEALYINHKFNQRFDAPQRRVLEERANRADREIYRIKKKAFKSMEGGTGEAEILTRIGQERVRCPLLNDQKQCEMYAFRPITCRLYGIPTLIGGQAHTCGQSGFKEGEPYPTVNMDQIFARLQEISASLVRDINSRHVKLADLLVPLSMVLLTDYNDEYLGLLEKREEAGDRTEEKKGE